jgi:hypothetical protein
VNRRDLLRSLAAASVAVPVGALAAVMPRDFDTASMTYRSIEALPFRRPDPALLEAIPQLEDSVRMASYPGLRSGPTSAQFRAAFEPGIRRAHEAVYDKHAAEWEEVFK